MISESFQITIEPISPVFVWSGEVLYNNADYKLLAGKIIVVDIDKALREVGSLDEAFRPEYAREIHGFKLVFSSTFAPNEILMINNNIIPASSLKGLIRTSVLNAMTNQTVFNEVQKNLQGLSNANPKQLSKLLKSVGEPVEELAKVRVPFGRGTFRYDAFSRLLISEPKVENPKFSLDKIEIKETVGNFHKEVYAITFVSGKLTYDVKIVKPSDYGVHSSVKQKDVMISKQVIVNSLKRYSDHVLKKEKSKVANNNKYAEYSKFLESLKTSDNCIPLKIGRFTGHVSKTIELPQQLEATRSQILTRVLRHTWDNRTVKLVKGIGVGWVKLCVT